MLKLTVVNRRTNCAHDTNGPEQSRLVFWIGKANLRFGLAFFSLIWEYSFVNRSIQNGLGFFNELNLGFNFLILNLMPHRSSISHVGA